MKRERKRKKIVIEDYKELMAALAKMKNQRHRVWIQLALMDGLRATEIAKLRWCDILDRRKKVKKQFRHKHAKMKSKAKIKLSKCNRTILQELLKYRKKRKWYCFRGRVKAHIGRFAIYRAWRRLQIKIWGKWMYSLHYLRHTAITRKYIETKSKKKAQKFARHVRPDTTDIYIHLQNAS